MSNLTSCKVTTDCSSVYHTCSSDGVCGCSHSTGATGEKCLYTSSGDATVYFALICFYASVWLGFLVYHTHCTFVVFRSGKKGAILKFTILLEIGVAGEVVREGCRMVSLSSPDSFGPGALHTFEKVDLTTLTFAATGALSGAMVMGLIWVEFVLASQRMANVGNDLKLTAKILQVTTGSYLVLSVMLTVWHASLTPNTMSKPALSCAASCCCARILLAPHLIFSGPQLDGAHSGVHGVAGSNRAAHDWCRHYLPLRLEQDGEGVPTSSRLDQDRSNARAHDGHVCAREHRTAVAELLGGGARGAGEQGGQI